MAEQRPSTTSPAAMLPGFGPSALLVVTLVVPDAVARMASPLWGLIAILALVLPARLLHVPLWGFEALACLFAGRMIATELHLPYPLTILVPLTLLIAWAVLRKFSLREGLWARGGFTTHWRLAVGIAAASIAVLGCWLVWHFPVRGWALIPAWPPAALVPLGIAFAVFNATVEELVFRSMLLTGLSRSFGAFRGQFAQAWFFGLFHVSGGVPDDASGFVLAMAFGIAMGYLLVRTRSLLSPIVSHAIVDLFIFWILVASRPPI